MRVPPPSGVKKTDMASVPCENPVPLTVREVNGAVEFVLSEVIVSVPGAAAEFVRANVAWAVTPPTEAVTL